MSERKEWTDAGTEITVEDEEVNIRVNPLFVPLGEEDEIRVAVGVLVNEDGDYPGFVYVWIWKDEEEIFVQHGHKITQKSQGDFEEDTEIEIAVELDTDHLVELGEDFYGEEDYDSATDDDDYFATDNEDEDEEEEDKEEADEEEEED